MSDLLSPILYVIQNEVDAFWCFCGFMELVVRLGSGVGHRPVEQSRVLAPHGACSSPLLPSHSKGTLKRARRL